MKAVMDARGVITLQAETSVETFALKQWSSLALVMNDDPKRVENCYWRGSMLIVDADESQKGGAA